MMVRQSLISIKEDAQGIAGPTENNPVEANSRHIRQHGRKRKDGHPAHAEIQGQGKPFPFTKKENFISNAKEDQAPEDRQIE